MNKRQGSQNPHTLTNPTVGPAYPLVSFHIRPASLPLDEWFSNFLKSRNPFVSLLLPQSPYSYPEDWYGARQPGWWCTASWLTLPLLPISLWNPTLGGLHAPCIEKHCSSHPWPANYFPFLWKALLSLWAGSRPNQWILLIWLAFLKQWLAAP